MIKLLTWEIEDPAFATRTARRPADNISKDLPRVQEHGVVLVSERALQSHALGTPTTKSNSGSALAVPPGVTELRLSGRKR